MTTCLWRMGYHWYVKIFFMVLLGMGFDQNDHISSNYHPTFFTLKTGYCSSWLHSNSKAHKNLSKTEQISHFSKWIKENENHPKNPLNYNRSCTFFDIWCLLVYCGIKVWPQSGITPTGTYLDEKVKNDHISSQCPPIILIFFEGSPC